MFRRILNQIGLMIVAVLIAATVGALLLIFSTVFAWECYALIS